MTDSAHNLQKEQVDVNSFWKWPASYILQQWTPTKIFEPEMFKWAGVSTNGYCLSRDRSPECCIFTDCSVSSKTTPSGYRAGTFLDLRSGSYIMSFESDDTVNMYISYFIWKTATEVQFGGQWLTFNNIPAGSNKIHFEIPESCLCCFSFGGSGDVWVTLTNIVIREGVL